jgi:hypothetical protein
MPLTYSKNKQHIYNWRMNHIDHYHALNRIHQRKYQTWKKIKFEFLSILLPEL